MSLDAIMSKVADLLETIGGMGLVYPYELHVSQASELRTLCYKAGRVNFWTIARERSLENRLPSRVNERHHGLAIRAYYGLSTQGASEQEFEALLEAVCDLFRTIPALQGACETSTPLQVDRPDPHRYLGEVLCHYAELRLSAQELLNW